VELFHARNTELRLAEAGAEEAGKYRPDLEAVEARMRNEPEERRGYENKLEAARDELKKLVTVVQPDPSKGDRARVVETKDDRWLYIAGSWLGIVLVFGVTAVILSMTGGERVIGQGQWHPLDADTVEPGATVEEQESRVG